MLPSTNPDDSLHSLNSSGDSESEVSGESNNSDSDSDSFSWWNGVPLRIDVNSVTGISSVDVDEDVVM